MEIGSLLLRTDYLRRSSARAGDAPGHKEWLHFCLQQGDLDILVNFSVSDEVDRDAGRWAERGHVIVLVRDGDTWLGDVDRFGDPDMDIAGGEVAARMGESWLWLRAGKLHVSATLREVRLRVELVLSPETFPSFANNIRLDRRDSLSWLVVPRLRATGTLWIGDRAIHVEQAIAYHDHNWGHFAWGADFAWEWGYGAPVDPACPWSFMFVRLSDRAMTSTRTQALTLWFEERIVRSFRGADLRVSTSGFLKATKVFKIPPVMGLLSPGTATEVPGRLSILAEADGDRLEFILEPRGVAQIIVPNDRAAGVTIVNEVAATLRVRGRVLGEAVCYEGRGMFEVLAS